MQMSERFRFGEALVLRRLLTGLTAVALMITAACGSSSSDDSKDAGSSGPDTIKVGVIPIVDTAPIHLGVAKGFFKEQNLDVQLVTVTGGAEAIAQVVAGKLDFSFTNIVSAILARSRGLPLKLVSVGNASTGQNGKDFGGIVVPKGSPITSAAELAGKRVAVNNLKNIGDTSVRSSIRTAGGDPTTVKFVELLFPDIPAAVAKKQVDGAFLVEPFLTITLDQGAKLIASNFVDTAPDVPIGVYFTTQQTVTGKADLTRRFTTAIKKSLQYAQDHPDETRQALLTYTKITPDIADRITLPAYPQEINRAAVATLVEKMRSDGLLTKDVNLAEILP